MSCRREPVTGQSLRREMNTHMRFISKREGNGYLHEQHGHNPRKSEWSRRTDERTKKCCTSSKKTQEPNLMIDNCHANIWRHVIDPSETPEIQEVIKTGVVTNIKGLKYKLSKYRRICIEKYLMPEAEYFAALISRIPELEIKYQTKIRQIEHETVKRIDILNAEINAIETSCDIELERIQKNLTTERIKLDQKFQDCAFLKSLAKPSDILISMRAEARRLLDEGKYDSTEMLLNEMRQLEQEETQKAQQRIQELYETEDTRISRTFLDQQLCLIRDSTERLCQIETEKINLLNAYEEELNETDAENLSFNSVVKGDIEWGNDGYLPTRPPRVLNRKCDIELFHELADQRRIED